MAAKREVWGEPGAGAALIIGQLQCQCYRKTEKFKNTSSQSCPVTKLRKMILPRVVELSSDKRQVYRLRDGAGYHS